MKNEMQRKGHRIMADNESRNIFVTEKQSHKIIGDNF
jgi:hypothetical protein